MTFVAKVDVTKRMESRTLERFRVLWVWGLGFLGCLGSKGVLKGSMDLVSSFTVAAISALSRLTPIITTC